ncbi:MAG TPA: hypothetical protein VEY33_14110 [Gemmatimonadota bacterium]|nr:hypothetical protein [Gemmatimonadota bacterium]
MILNSGRCGSTVLLRMLDAHPRACSRGEVFHRYDTIYGGCPRRPDPLRYLERELRRVGRRHFVFSVHFLRAQHLRPDLLDMQLEEFLRVVHGMGVNRIVLLERRNYLRIILSSYAGALREQWHVPALGESEVKSFVLDPDRVEFARTTLPLTAWLEEFERGYAEARGLVAAVSGLYLTYEEDVLPDPGIGHRKLCAVMGLPALDVEVSLRRSNPFPVREMLRNFEKVERHLRGTRFAWMLDAE